MARRRGTDEQTKGRAVRADGDTRASSTIETGTYGRTDPLGRDALREAAKGEMVGTRTGATKEGAA